MSSNRNALPDGTILNSRYKIERFIGGGGFGLVYQAKHLQLNMTVAIKELLPSNIATRGGGEVHPISSDSEGIYQQTLSSFRKEGKRLVQLINCEHIVRCSDYFEENNTGYLVMDYVEGTPLTSFIESYKEEGQSFSQTEIVSWLKDLLAGLKQVHKKGILHLDIKPGNIFIRRKDERPILLDFGASKSTTGHSTGSGLLIGTAPYAPFEQMQRNGNMGPWSDIYALGMMMYQLVFGDDIEELPSSNERVEEDRLESAKSRGKSRYSDEFLSLIDKCVSREIKERPQSIEKMEELLLFTEGETKSNQIRNDSKFCIHCGMQLINNPKYCSNCGQSTNGNTMPEERDSVTAKWLKFWSNNVPEHNISLKEISSRGMKWLKFWNYFILPVGGVWGLLTGFNMPLSFLSFSWGGGFGLVQLLLYILHFAVAYGLHRRRVWAWRWNWWLVVYLYVEASIFLAVLDYPRFSGLVEATIFYSILVDIGTSFMAVISLMHWLIFFGLIWVWPNYVYWQKRKDLFS